MKHYKKTIFGASIIILWFIASILFSVLAPEELGREMLLYDDKEELIGRAPVPPNMDHILGTDRNGYDNFYTLLEGAKYTISIAIIVALFRVLIGGIIGLVLELYIPKWKVYFYDFFLPLKYLPLVIITILLISPFSIRFMGISLMEIIFWQLLILVWIAVPTVASTTGELVQELQKKAFVQHSFLMGASKLHVIRKQFMPYLYSYGTLFFVQQVFQTLVILMHISLFGLFVGGPTLEGVFTGDPDSREPASLSNEWAGLIGQNYRVFIQYPWIVLSNMLGFFVLLTITNIIKKELEDQPLPMAKKPVLEKQKTVTLKESNPFTRIHH